MTSVFSNNPFKIQENNFSGCCEEKLSKVIFFHSFFLGVLRILATSLETTTSSVETLWLWSLTYFGVFFGGKFFQSPPQILVFRIAIWKFFVFSETNFRNPEPFHPNVRELCLHGAFWAKDILQHNTQYRKYNTLAELEWIWIRVAWKEGAGSLISSNFSPKTNLSFSEKSTLFFQVRFFYHPWMKNMRKSPISTIILTPNFRVPNSQGIFEAIPPVG